MGEPLRCATLDCQHAARWAPCIHVPAQGWPKGTHQPARMIVGIKVCTDCFARITVEELLSDQVREVVKTFLRGMAPPAFDRATIERLALDHPQVLALDASRGPRQ